MKIDVPEPVRIRTNRKVVQGGLGGPVLVQDLDELDARTVREERRKRVLELEKSREVKP